MGEQKIIGRGTWIDKLAYELVEREKNLGRNTNVIKVESGLGASGIPHIGSLGDAARAYGVKLALENFGYKSELIAYSDDMDGLRKIPEGFSGDLGVHLGKPVSQIQDPKCGKHDSFASHMVSQLLEGLDDLGIKYRHQKASDTYKNGLLNDQIHTILVNSKKIGEKISELVGQEKYKESLPYFPICSRCNKIYTTEAYEYLENERKVKYRCETVKLGSGNIEGCGNEGIADITKGEGKLSWKVEFAARWQGFDVRFEAYGKDIMDSVKVNDWVSDEILNYPHPHHVKYEMLLDKGGKKISKSLGNVLTSQEWLNYGTAESILLLLYKRITGAREVGFEDIPSLMDEYNELEDIYFGKIKVDNEAKLVKLKGLYEYVKLCNVPNSAGTHISYRLLVDLCKIFKDARKHLVIKKLIEYGVIKNSNSEIERLIDLASNYADKFEWIGTTEIKLEGATRKAIEYLEELLTQKNVPEDLQNSIYKIAKDHKVPTKDFFKILYQIILATDRGPRIGPYINDIGREKVARRLREHLHN